MAYQLSDLLTLMQNLRDPQWGCPWDLKQDFASIVPSTLEEAYELAQTIEDQDFEHMREELGDLLFQVVFYSQLASEKLDFDFHAVVDELAAKLIRRHPHVFPENSLESFAAPSSLSEAEIKRNWEKTKQAERDEKNLASVLDDVPLALPALTRAQKLQKRCANVGFDWPDSRGVWDKLKEEIAECEAAMASKNQAEIEHEIGDLMFCLVNLARHQGLDAERCLRQANNRFSRRFNYVEQQVAQSEQSLEQTSLTQMDLFWDQAKQQGL